MSDLQDQISKWQELAEQRNPLIRHIVDAEGSPISLEIDFFHDPALIKYKRVGFFAFTQRIEGAASDDVIELMGMKLGASVDVLLDGPVDAKQMLDSLEVSIMNKLYHKIYNIYEKT